jgi:hypothetical protein
VPIFAVLNTPHEMRFIRTSRLLCRRVDVALPA